MIYLMFLTSLSCAPSSGESIPALAAKIKKHGGDVVYAKGAEGRRIETIILRDSPAAKGLLKEFGVLQTLDRLDLAENEIDDMDLAGLHNLIELKTLALGNTKVTGVGLAHLRRCRSLTNLNLQGTPTGNKGLEQLRPFTALERLHLSMTEITDEGLKNLKHFPELWELGLSANAVSDKGLIGILPFLPKLEGLHLAATKVTDAGIREVKNLRRLTFLSLNATQITDRALKDIGELENLETLGLQHCPNLSDAGLVHLARLKKLKELDLLGTKITEKGVAFLKQKLPELEIDWVKPFQAPPQKKLAQLWLPLVFLLQGRPRPQIDELEAELSSMDKLRNGTETPFDQVEELGSRLLKKFSSPKDQGRIYYQLAHVYAQSGMAKPERTIEYAKKALACPLERDQKIRLHVYWGDAIRVTDRSKPFAKTRKEAAIVYLAGLKEVLVDDLPDKLPPPPKVPADLSPTDPRFLELFIKHSKEQEKLEGVKKMMMHHDVLTGQLTEIYSRPPFATDELERLAKKSLPDRSKVAKLVEKVQTAVAKAEATLPKEILEAAKKEAQPEVDSDGNVLIILTVTAMALIVLFGVYLGFRKYARKG